MESLMNGEIKLTDRESISSHILDCIRSLYAKEDWDTPALDNLDFASISEDSPSWLEIEFEEREVWDAVFNLRGDKAPGPNGFPMAFFQQFWDLLKEDAMAFMREFHSRGKLFKSIRASITLIPNKRGVDRLKDFRPISLISSIYKILDKVLAIRLQKIMPSMIYPAKGAFVHGRQIFDEVLIALICKLDLKKAYNKVDWGFLYYMLSRMGFGVKWRRGILECASSAHFSILINGAPKGFFPAKKGLHQRYPFPICHRRRGTTSDDLGSWGG